MTTLAELTDRLREEIIDDERIIEAGAKAIESAAVGSIIPIIIKKYGALPEELFSRICRRAVELTRNNPNTGIAYLAINQGLIERVHEAGNEAPLYTGLVNSVLEAVEGTRFEDEKIKTFRNWMDTNQKRIYNPRTRDQVIFEDKETYEKPFFDAGKNFGANLKLLTRHIRDIPRRVVPIIDLQILPPARKGTVKVLEQGSLPVTPNPEFEQRLKDHMGLLTGTIVGSDGGNIVLATPGWTIDVLKPEPENQYWNLESFREEAVLREVSYCEVIEL